MTSIRRNRPSSVDLQLTDRPDLAAAAERVARHPTMTVDKGLEAMRALGIKVSRSAYARYRQRFSHRLPGPIGKDRAELMHLVGLLRDESVESAVLALRTIIDGKHPVS